MIGYLENGSKWASRRDLIAVRGRARQEDRDGHKNADGGDGKAPFPAFVVFNPHHKSDSNEGTK